MKKLVIVCLIFVMGLLTQSCGNATSGGGDPDPGNPGGGGGNSTITKTFTFRVEGYGATNSPVLHVAANGVNWDPGSTFNQVGQVQVEIPYLPQNVQVNVSYGDSENPYWAVNSDGVCQGLKLFVGDVEITTWATNSYGGNNYSFTANTDETITLTGSAIVSKDCSGGGGGTCTQRAMNYQLTGYAAGSNPELYCSGDGVNWIAHPLDANGRVTLNGCAGTYQCNAEFVNGTWLANADGVCNGMSLSVNNVEVTTWIDNGSGGRNLSYRMTDAGAIELNGTAITRKDCSGGGGGSCTQRVMNYQLTGYAAGSNPELYCTGDGVNWSAHPLDANGQIMLNGCADTYYDCNVRYANGTWLANADGVCSGQSLAVNNVVLTTWMDSGYGGYNFSYYLTATGMVELYGTAITTKDCSVRGPCSLHFTYQGSYADPRLHLYGGGVSWNTATHFASDGGMMSVTVEANPDNFVANMDMKGDYSLWLVTNEGILVGQSLYLNGTLLDHWQSNGYDGGNLYFTVNQACQVVWP
jgi:hypothetical protein